MAQFLSRLVFQIIQSNASFHLQLSTKTTAKRKEGGKKKKSLTKKKRKSHPQLRISDPSFSYGNEKSATISARTQNTHKLSLSLSLTHTHTLYLFPSVCMSSITPTQHTTCSLSLSLTHSQTHTHTHTHTNPFFLCVCPVLNTANAFRSSIKSEYGTKKDKKINRKKF